MKEFEKINLEVRKSEPKHPNKYVHRIAFDGKWLDWNGVDGTLPDAFSHGCGYMIEEWVARMPSPEKRTAYLNWYRIFDTRAAYIRLKMTEVEGWQDFEKSQELVSAVGDIREHLLGSRFSNR